ncbi:MAG: hypothetical protein AAFZ18_16740 [Myxococcota bacterium]
MTGDGVLPLIRADAERAKLLLERLGRFFTHFGRLYVVAPAPDLDAVRSVL